MNRAIGTGTVWRRGRSAYLGCALAMLAPFAMHNAGAQTVLPSDAKALCPVASSTFNSWFESGTPALNGSVNPANSITFPHNSDCAFYAWSAQMFLWLTSPAPPSYGGTSFVFTSPVFYNVSGKDANGDRTYSRNTPEFILPMLSVRSAQVGPNGLQRMFAKDGRAFEVLPAPLSEKGRPLIRDSAGKFVEIHKIEAVPGKKPKFLGAGNKPIAVPAAPKLDTTLAAKVAPKLLTKLDSKVAKKLVQGFQDPASGKTIFVDSLGNTIEPTQGQAGSLSGVLLGQNQSLVYYATMVNDVYAFFQTGTTNGTIPNPNNVFPTSQAELNPVIAYAASKGVAIPDGIALAVEIKTSWIDVTGLSNLGLSASNYITVNTAVPEYNTSNPSLWIPTGKNKPVTLALVGMHVVGSANGHPEMIWATMEHMSNAPAGAYTYTNTSGTNITVPQTTNGKWLLSVPNTPTTTAFNVQYANYTAAPNITAIAPNVISPSNTIRWKAFGSGADNSNATNENTEVISLNNSVRGQMPAGDVRTNYILTGATWTIGGQTVTDTNQVGTALLANTTMETYDQGTDNKQASGTNCFGCHSNGDQPVGQPANTTVSHIFSSLIPLYPGSTSAVKK